VFLHPPESEISTLLLFRLKEMGGMVLMVSVMLFLAARDPERNVAVVDGLVFGLIILAVTPLLSLYTLDVRRIYPSHLVWGRSVVRLLFAAFFYYLRPRKTQWRPLRGISEVCCARTSMAVEALPYRHELNVITRMSSDSTWA